MMIYTHFKKVKPKLKSRKERDEYDAWLAKHQSNVKSTKMAYEPLKYSLSMPAGRTTTKNIPSLNTGLAVASAKPAKVYTGDKMLGIGTLHKSNAVPVFSTEEAEDMAKMRR